LSALFLSCYTSLIITIKLYSTGTYLGNTKSVTVASTRPFRNRPTTPSLPPPPVVHNTPEPQQKVNQWLENAVDSPSMTESAMEAEEENISSSSTFKTPSNGKATTSSKTSSLGKDSFLELRSSSPPGLRSSVRLACLI